jgi:hypothetical protein
MYLSIYQWDYHKYPGEDIRLERFYTQLGALKKKVLEQKLVSSTLVEGDLNEFISIQDSIF